MATTGTPTKRPAPTDPQTAERLARLAARNQAGRPVTPPRQPNRAASLPPPAARSGATGNPNRPQVGRPAPPSRRRHPAKRSRYAALGMSVAATGGLAAWFNTLDHAGAIGSRVVPTATGTAAAPAAAPAAATSNSAASATPDATTTAAPVAGASAPAIGPPVATASAYVDGTFTGDLVQTRWGPVEVQVTIAGGKITAADAPVFPDADRKSVWINQQAVPMLNDEVLTAQSGTIDMISGATYTSYGYLTSLQSVLDKAKSAVATTG